MGTLGKTWRRKWEDTEVLKAILLSKREIAPSGCWLWLGGKNHAGYGTIRVDGVHCNVQRVSLWVFKRDRRAKIKGHKLYACHRCDTPACFKPSHLFMAKPWQNTQDAIRKSRRPSWRDRTHCKKGHELNGRSYLWKGVVNGHKVWRRICLECAMLRERRYRAVRNNARAMLNG